MARLYLLATSLNVWVLVLVLVLAFSVQLILGEPPCPLCVLQRIRVQLLIPGDTFHTARLLGNHWFLGASTEWPGVVPADVEIGDVQDLAQKYPTVAADLRAIAASVG